MIAPYCRPVRDQSLASPALQIDPDCHAMALLDDRRRVPKLERSNGDLTCANAAEFFDDVLVEAREMIRLLQRMLKRRL
jgi:hypothetical protein